MKDLKTPPVVNGIKYPDWNSLIDKSIQDMEFQTRFLKLLQKNIKSGEVTDAELVKTFVDNLKRFDLENSPARVRREFINSILD